MLPAKASTPWCAKGVALALIVLHKYQDLPGVPGIKLSRMKNAKK